MSLVDMFEVKFLLPFLGGRHANKFRKLSRYASSLGIVAAHGNVGKPCCPGETVRCWRSCEMIEKTLCFPGLRASSISQSLSYVCPLPECNPREEPYVCQCPAPLIVIGIMALGLEFQKPFPEARTTGESCVWCLKF